MPDPAQVRSFFDSATHTVTHLVWDPATREAVIIDPVLDYDHRSGRADTALADRVLAAVQEQQVRVGRILETHAHADHLSAAPYLKHHTGAPIAIGERIRDVQELFAPLFRMTGLSCTGSEFDHLLKDGESLPLGELDIRVLHTPGHTPACVSFHIGDAVFVGDTLFMPDYGTARADFPGGDARLLYRSIRRLLALPADTRLFLCHDYLTPGRDHHVWETTVDAQRRHNIHVHDGISEEDFVQRRQQRDATLPAPALLLPSIQVNIRAGHLPPADPDGLHRLRIPMRLSPSLSEMPS